MGHPYQPIMVHRFGAMRVHSLATASAVLVGRSRKPKMSISFNLDDEQSARLEERARELGVDARELAKAAVNDLLTRPADDFDRAAKLVLEKNRELYRRLS